jgi:hypothetical protein
MQEEQRESIKKKRTKKVKAAINENTIALYFCSSTILLFKLFLKILVTKQMIVAANGCGEKQCIIQTACSARRLERLGRKTRFFHK